MANAKKCDICGKYYDLYCQVKLENGMIISGCRLRFTADNDCCWNSVDLCQECMAKVHMLLSSIEGERLVGND